MNKNTGFFLVVLLIIGILFYIQPKGTLGMKIHYYRNGEEVYPGLFSIIDGQIYDQISFDITGTSDTEISDIQIIDASPVEFKNALPTAIQSLDVGETKTLYVSDLIDTVDLESYSQPINFWISISGYDEYGKKTIFTESSLDLTIKPELSGDYLSLISANSILYKFDKDFNFV